ncbi:hypothetical protein NGM10_09905 [Halorussus salilacus]|uniref:hypothetical protein n=1 Tax=Halorussus salilacus TaxID=2953750 RepID=UPI0020A0CD8C|nr:hypothetical protein [Halorussus salilacus]USZ67043.1 hypothetical protein NGM10_09905 [Halorussus salilacus]
MANVRSALARGFAVAVVLVLLLVGGYVLVRGGFGGEGLLAYLLALALATGGAVGIWTERYRASLAATVGMVVLALLQSPFLLGLAVLLAVALVVGWSGRTRERLEVD